MKQWIYQKALGFILREHHKWRLGKGGIRLDLSNAFIPAANFTGAQMKECEFISAQMDGSDFRSAFLVNGSFREAHFDLSRFDQAQMVRCTFDEADMSFSIFKDAILRKVRWNLQERNRQAEELRRIKADARVLWDFLLRVERLIYHAEPAVMGAEVALVLRTVSDDLRKFLKENNIQEPLIERKS